MEFKHKQLPMIITRPENYRVLKAYKKKLVFLTCKLLI